MRLNKFRKKKSDRIYSIKLNNRMNSDLPNPTDLKILFDALKCKSITSLSLHSTVFG